MFTDQNSIVEALMEFEEKLQILNTISEESKKLSIQQMDEKIFNSLSAMTVLEKSNEITYSKNTQHQDTIAEKSLQLNLSRTLEFLAKNSYINFNKALYQYSYNIDCDVELGKTLMKYVDQKNASHFFETIITHKDPKKFEALIYLLKNHKDKIHIDFLGKDITKMPTLFFNNFSLFLNSGLKAVEKKEDYQFIIDNLVEQLLPLKNIIIKHVNEDHKFFSTHYFGFVEGCLHYLKSPPHKSIEYFLIQLIEKGFVYNHQMEPEFKNRKPFFHECCEKGAIGLMDYLFQKNPDLLNLKDKKNKTPIFYSRDTGTFNYLLEKGSSWQQYNQDNFLISELYAIATMQKNVKFKEFLLNFVQENSIDYQKVFAKRSLISWMFNNKTEGPKHLNKIKDFTQRQLLRIACESGNSHVVKKIDNQKLGEIIQEKIDDLNYGLFLFKGDNSKKKFENKMLLLEKFLDNGLNVNEILPVLLKGRKKPTEHNLITLFFTTQRMYTKDEKLGVAIPDKEKNTFLMGNVLEKMLRQYDWNNCPNWKNKDMGNFILKGLNKNAFMYYPFDMFPDKFKKSIFFALLSVDPHIFHGFSESNLNKFFHKLNLNDLVFTPEELEKAKLKMTKENSMYKKYFTDLYEYLAMQHEKQKTESRGNFKKNIL